MKGFLERLGRRAGGHRDGLRPWVPVLFEPVASLAEDAAAAPESVAPARESGHAESAPRAISGAAQATQSPPQGVVDTASPMHESIRAERVAGPRSGSARPDAPPPREPEQDVDPTPRGRAAREVRARRQGLPARRARLAASAGVAGRSVVSDREPASSDIGVASPPSFSAHAVVPGLGLGGAQRFVPERERGVTSEAVREPVVNVVIERLDVQAVSPVDSKRRRNSSARRDTLAEYQRRREEAAR